MNGLEMCGCAGSGVGAHRTTTTTDRRFIRWYLSFYLVLYPPPPPQPPPHHQLYGASVYECVGLTSATEIPRAPLCSFARGGKECHNHHVHLLPSAHLFSSATQSPRHNSKWWIKTYTTAGTFAPCFSFPLSFFFRWLYERDFYNIQTYTAVIAVYNHGGCHCGSAWN